MIERIFAFLLASLFLCLAFTACGEEKKNSSNSDEEEINIADAYTPDKEILDTVVMKIGDIEITYETYRYYYMSCRSTYEAVAISKTAKQLKEEVLQELVYQAAIQTLANQYGAGLTDKQTQTVNAAYAELLATYAEYGSNLVNALAMKYMTPKIYTDAYAFEAYAVENVYNHCIDKENNVLDFSEEAVSEMLSEFDRALMIYVGITETRTEENARKKVEGILEKLEAGEDFVEIATQYSDVASG